MRRRADGSRVLYRVEVVWTIADTPQEYDTLSQTTAPNCVKELLEESEPGRA